MGRVSAVKLAKYLAREVMYRGFRSGGPLTPRTYGWGGGRRRQPSALSSNMYAILYAIMSFSAAMPFFFRSGPLALLPVTILYALGLTVLLGIGLAFSLIQVTPFTSTFISEGVVDLLRLLPLSEGEVFRTYLAALYLYWGGASLAALYIPFLGVSAYASLTNGLPATYVGVGAFTAASVVTFAPFLGVIIGAYSYLTRRRVSMRAASTALWLASFILMYLFYSLMPKIIEAMAGTAPALESFGWAIPFVGPLFSVADPVKLALSVCETLAIVVATYRFASAKVRTILVGGEYAVAAAPTLVRPAGLRVMGALKAMVWKDVKLLSREPRRLASLLYLAIFPIIIVFVNGGPHSSGSFGQAFSYLAAYMVGGLSGMGVDNLFFVEGSAAPLLYALPVDRRFIALSKALATSSITLPIAVAVGAIATYLSGGPSAAAFGAAVAGMLNLGTSLLNSYINVKMVPQEPSEWNPMTFGITAGRRAFRGIVKVLMSVACGIVPMVIALALPLALHLSGATLHLIMLAYPAAILAAGAAAVARLKGKTLTE